MLLIDPRDCGVAGLDLTVFHQSTRRTTPETPVGRFADLERRAERHFLNALKYRYGYVGPDDAARRKDDPEFAYYFWARDNGGIEDGVMKVRRYKGRPASLGSVEAEVSDGPRTYTAEFKAGVVVYDSAKDEHYVLYHPQDMYAFPVVLKLAGPYLVIGTRGEGIAAVELKTLRLKRVRFHGPDDDVKTLEVKDGALVVNGVRTVPLSGL